MTRKELEKYFRHPRYIGMEDYIRKVMKDRPDIDNEDDIEYAAAIMQECDGDGVELSTENALRLTKIRDEEMTRAEQIRSAYCAASQSRVVHSDKPCKVRHCHHLSPVHHIILVVYTVHRPSLTGYDNTVVKRIRIKKEPHISVQLCVIFVWSFTLC